MFPAQSFFAVKAPVLGSFPKPGDSIIAEHPRHVLKALNALNSEDLYVQNSNDCVWHIVSLFVELGLS